MQCDADGRGGSELTDGLGPLVDRLRECAADDDDCLPQTTVRAGVMREAADEIERLRSILRAIDDDVCDNTYT